MKKIIAILFLSHIIFAQQIVTQPEFPTETDSIVLTFNIQEMTGRAVDLIGYTGDLYTHTGVNTNLGDWQHVIGSWGNNSLQPKLTRVGTDIYELVINNPRIFYNLDNPNEHITSLNFVLRSADASKQTEDLFVIIYETGINIKFIMPDQFPFYPEIGSSFDLSLTTNGADSISLFLNNQLLLTSANDTISQNITNNTTGKKWIKYIVEGNGLTLVDSVSFYVREKLSVVDPPAGTQTGINYIDDNTVTLALFAPNKDFVYLIGDFNNWNFDPPDSNWSFETNYYLKLSSDSTVFWTTLTNLEAGQEYRYQYLVDGTLRIADPYSDKILEEEDSDINESTYPNLIDYPDNKTNYSVSVFQTAQPAYQWEAFDYKRPEKQKLIIYELLIRDFVSEHNYATLIDSLNYLEKLGVNAIELMPVNEFEWNESWGYDPSFYFAPDKYYGPKNDLKKFIDECHKRNIAVIMDIVLNHSYGRSPFVRLYADGEFGPPSSDNLWYNTSSPNPVFSWGYDFNHESIYTQQLVDRINKYWLEEYNFDGFRFDFTKGFTNKPGDGSAYDQSRINILKRMSDKIWEVDSTAYVILEHFAADSEEQVLSDYGMLIWGNNNYNYNEATMGYHDGGKSNFSRISYTSHGFSKPHLVGYMESHDEERLMYKNLQYGNSSGSYDITNLPTALNRIKLAAAFFVTVPGPKMIWQFGELGYDYSIDYNSRTGNKPIRWDYFDDVNRKNLYKTYSALNYLKNNYEAFSTDDFNMNVSSSVKRIRLNHPTMNVAIIGNFDVINKNISPAFQNTGMWYDYFSGDSINVVDSLMTFTLEPGEFYIFTTQKLPTPEKDILLNADDNFNESIPEQFTLNQNYPNPFNPSTIITYSIPQNLSVSSNQKKVTLKVYDLLGREIKTLVNEYQIPGKYTISFDANNLSSGVYYYQLKAGNFIRTKKMMLLK